ncbi:DNA polymerase IV [Enterovibrio norvegicus FF-33]|uniref:DNA polymerase IV n=1 Tax=Enterovibrio norvegicus FF-454 TaxID=1185651 RepID=A0A1E5C650_9GAMM|nr:DNA polymerase IV [Enterovibrio norvegicus]OEE60672.1 DNA polymerase IV [Enterovibrio norvegicus FF-454]OEE69914.1 DNA polymerase IV [Enterovibrio norvegicus FF-33]
MKKIVHIDMDCFYAAVEMRDSPELRDIPLAIGGSETRRGVISTCNYLARKYGVRSAMATAHAKKLCPNLTVVRGDMNKYKAVSLQIRAIFARYTDKVEPLSLDEAYLDVSDCSLFRGSATLIAEDIRQAIKRELGLTASAGVAPVKFIAKVASDLNKPDGIYVITPDEIDAFVKNLPLEKIPGVGKVTLVKLHELGLFKGEDVQQFDQNLLLQRFGKFGHALWNRCQGIDERDVETDRVRKSVGVERTLPEDIRTEAECLAVMESLYDEMETRLKRVCPDMDIARQGVKLKFSDFQLTSVEHRQWCFDTNVFPDLLKEALARQQGRGVRLIGLSVGLKSEDKDKAAQLSFEW